MFIPLIYSYYCNLDLYWRLHWTCLCGPKGRDRCSKWYLGHVGPSLAPCERGNRCKWAFKLVAGGTAFSEATSFIPFILSWAGDPDSRCRLVPPPWLFGSQWLTSDGDPDAQIFSLAPHGLRLGSEIPLWPGSAAHHCLDSHQDVSVSDEEPWGLRWSDNQIVFVCVTACSPPTIT